MSIIPNSLGITYDPGPGVAIKLCKNLTCPEETRLRWLELNWHYESFSTIGLKPWQNIVSIFVVLGEVSCRLWSSTSALIVLNKSLASRRRPNTRSWIAIRLVRKIKFKNYLRYGWQIIFAYCIYSIYRICSGAWGSLLNCNYFGV